MERLKKIIEDWERYDRINPDDRLYLIAKVKEVITLVENLKGFFKGESK